MSETTAIRREYHWQPLHIPRGASWSYEFDVVDNDGDAVDVSSMRVMAWLKSALDGEILVTKDSINGGEIDISSTSYTLHFEPNDTRTLTDGGCYLETHVIDLANGLEHDHVAIPRNERHNAWLGPTLIGDSDMSKLPTPFNRFMLLSGSREMNVDGTTAKNFDLVPDSGEVLRVKRIVLSIDCADAASLDEFGNLAALTNGILLKAFKTVSGVADTEISDLLGGFPAKDNRDLTNVAEVDFGNGIDSTYGLAVTFDLDDSPLRLVQSDGAYLRLAVQDDLQALDKFRASVIGTREDLLS